MSLAPKKIEILETLLMYDKPLRSKKIAEEMNNDFPEIQMHLVGLTKKGYTCSPEKAYYTITQEGRKALGFPEVDKQKAQAIMDCVPQNRAFHFYVEIHKPLNVHAYSLQEFFNDLSKVDLRSLEFHFTRGDFEAWFSSLGDLELAKKMELLKRKKMVGEELRNRLREIVEARCNALAKQLNQ